VYDFEGLMQALQNIPRFLEILIGLAAAGIVLTTAVGVVVAIQLARLTSAVRQATLRAPVPTAPPSPPPPGLTPFPYGSYQQRQP
jgi:hypothetical protein